MKLICPTSSSLTLLLLVSATSAWTSSPTTTTRSTTSLAATITSRHAFLQTLTSAVVATTLLSTTTPLSAGADETLPNGVAIVVKKSGSGPKPDVGELVAIRFAAYNGDLKIDDIFDTPEPYYTRLGSGGLLKGVESVLPMMKLGDRWVLTIPSDMAFGKKGRPASAGKPRIPGDAVITFDVEMVGLPGKEVELIELIGDE